MIRTLLAWKGRAPKNGTLEFLLTAATASALRSHTTASPPENSE